MDGKLLIQDPKGRGILLKTGQRFIHQRLVIRNLMRYQSRDFPSTCSKILATFWANKWRTAPKNEALTKTGLRGACLKFDSQGERLLQFKL